MDWARDHLGNDIPAWKGGISGFGLVCPSCGEPVRRRAGGERRPHFAHFSHRAKPDCENYFPLLGTTEVSALRSATVGLVDRLNRESLSCGLFLIHQSEQDSLKLCLRIPSVALGASAIGSLNIQSGVGHRTYHAADLHTARLVEIAPQFPLAFSTGFGDLVPLAAHILGQVEAFAADRNLFYAEEKGGRFVFIDEPLEWGVRYRLLAKATVAPPSDLGTTLEWKAERKFGEWNSYEMTMPLWFAASKSQLPSKISAFLGRRIRNSRPRLFVVQPSPHHIDIDGTYVYPEPTGSILLRRNAGGYVTVKTSFKSASTAVSELTDEWVRLEGLPTGGHDCIVSIDGNEQVAIRVEACDLFLPGGLSASANNVMWDLCAEAPIAPAELMLIEVNVDCRSVRIAAHIGLMNVGWKVDGPNLTAPGGSIKGLDAGSFGEIRGTLTDHPKLEEYVAHKSPKKLKPPSARRQWIEGLVITYFGQDGLDRVRRYLTDPSHANLCRLGLIMTSPLIPYIRAAHDQEPGDRS